MKRFERRTLKRSATSGYPPPRGQAVGGASRFSEYPRGIDRALRAVRREPQPGRTPDPDGHLILEVRIDCPVPAGYPRETRSFSLLHRLVTPGPRV